jgi:hypothetical protein
MERVNNVRPLLDIQRHGVAETQRGDDRRDAAKFPPIGIVLLDRA